MKKRYLILKIAAIFFLAVSIKSKAQVVLTYSYTGALQTLVVPQCVSTVTIETRGASGGSVTNLGNFLGGLGAKMTGVFSVATGNVLNIIVGGRGSNAIYTSGGGGGSGVGIGATALIVAGGGGGVDYQDPAYSGMNAVTGTAGNAGNTNPGVIANNGADGSDLVYTMANISRGGRGWNINNVGSLGNNGVSSSPAIATNGSWGLGGGGGAVGEGFCNCGGGGGGYSGGGAGGVNKSAGGGGSYNSGTNQVNVAGSNTGDGLVIISYFTNGSGVLASASSLSICSGSSATLNASNVVSYTWNPGGSNSASISVAPTVNTTYTIQGTNSLGCISSAMLTVTVDAGLPTVTVAATSTAVCSGKSVTYTANGATTYTWSGNASVTNVATYTPVLPGDTYTVTGDNACGSNSVTISVVTNTLPLVTASINNPTVCAGSNVIINGGGAVTFTWAGGYPNNSAFTPASTTNYTVTGSSVQGCTATAVTGVTVFTVPNAPPVASPTAICVGQTSTLSATGATSYSWIPGVNLVTQSITVSPAAPTTYTLYRSNGACTSTATINLVVNALPIMAASASPTQICAGQGSNLVVVGPITNTWSPGGFTQSNFTVFPNASKDYTVVGSNANCTISAVVSVSVNPTPTLTVGYSTPTLCSGGSSNLTANGAISYTWLAAGGTNLGGNQVISVSPATTAQYTLMGINASGCTATVNPLLVVYGLPNSNIVSSLPFICAGNSAMLGVTVTPGSTFLWNTGAATPSITVNPTVTTNYNLTVTTSSTGCQSNSVFPLSVFIATFAVTSPSAICKGSTATLSAVGAANSYTWNSGSTTVGSSSLITVSPQVTTVYNVTGATGNCVYSKTVGLTVNPVPPVTAVANKNPICLYDTSAYITANGATTYSWNTGETTPVIYVGAQNVSRTYTVTGTDDNTCSKTVTITLFVAICEGIESYSANKIQLDIYPNPNNGNFFISSDVNIDLSVVNTLGQEVSRFKADLNKKEIRLNNLPAGVYFITGKSGEMKVNKKIIIEK